MDSTPPDSEDAYARADALMSLRKGDEAIRVLELALVSDPDDPDLLTKLAWAYQDSGRNTDAVGAAERAIAADPEFAWPYVALAWARWGLSQRRAALEAAREATRLDPESPHAWGAVSFFAGRLGRGEEAEHARERATTLDPESPGVWLDAGSFGMTDDEFEAQRRSLELYPEDSMANNNYGYGLMRRGRFDEAVTYLERALSLDPGNQFALGNLATAFRRTGRIEEGLALQERGQAERLRDADSALSADPTAVWALRRRGAILWRRGEVDEGIRLIRRAIELEPDDAAAWGELSTAELFRGNIGEARRAAEIVNQLEPGFPDPLEVLGDIAALAGDSDRARMYASKLAERFPDTEQALAAAAAAALVDGDLEGAEQLYRQLLQTRATDCCSNALLGLTLARSGNTEGAFRCLQDAAALAESCPRVAFLKAELGAVKGS